MKMHGPKTPKINTKLVNNYFLNSERFYTKLTCIIRVISGSNQRRT